MSRKSSVGVQSSIPIPEPEPIDKQGLLDLIDLRLSFYADLVSRFSSLRDKIDGIPPGLQFDVTPEYGSHTVVGYKLTIKL